MTRQHPSCVGFRESSAFPGTVSHRNRLMMGWLSENLGAIMVAIRFRTSELRTNSGFCRGIGCHRGLNVWCQERKQTQCKQHHLPRDRVNDQTGKDPVSAQGCKNTDSKRNEDRTQKARKKTHCHSHLCHVSQRNPKTQGADDRRPARCVF